MHRDGFARRGKKDRGTGKKWVIMSISLFFPLPPVSFKNPSLVSLFFGEAILSIMPVSHGGPDFVAPRKRRPAKGALNDLVAGFYNLLHSFSFKFIY